jgi:hypothetical protein
MKKKHLIIFFFLLLTLLVLFVFLNKDNWSSQSKLVIYGQEKVAVEIELAKTKEERKQGLMYRESLDNKKGMLFIFPQQRKHNFWMKNTLIPLDIIHISADKKIVDCLKDIPPCDRKETCPVYSPNSRSKYVLEVNSGFCDKYKINQGDVVKFSLQ